MTSLDVPHASARPTARRIPGGPLVVTLALALGAAITARHALDVWRTGVFLDTDDAMRMTQVRDWLAGQAYFDMVAHRMDPPDGVLMHWSRIVDLPLAALLKLFGLFLPAADAEAATRIAFPLLMLGALYGAVAAAARAVGERATPFFAVALAFLGAPYLVQFKAGRIDHHAPQIVLLTLATAATMAAFEPARARLAALAGALAALSLSISLENAPFLALLAAAPAAAWIVEGARQRAALVAYALGLVGGLIAFFGVTVPPARYFETACDAYSFAHVAAGLAGGAGLLALAALTTRLPTMPARALAAALLGLAPLVALNVVAPACMGDPFVGLDPLVRALWLDKVAEVRSLKQLFADAPDSAVMQAAPTVLAAFAAFVLAFLSHGAKRGRLLLLAALIATGFVMTFWGVRVFSSVAPLVAVAGAAASAAALARLSVRGPARIALATLTLTPFAPLAWAVLWPPGADAKPVDAGSSACLRPETMRSLDRAPAGLVLAPVTAGAHLLAFTHHATIAAPYHRNNRGDRLSLDAFRAEPAAAQAIVRASGARYVLACPNFSEMRMNAQQRPQSLAAALVGERAPDWLEKIDGVQGPNVLYRVRN